MAYTAPRTWTAGEVVTAVMMNAEIRDNIGTGVMHKLAELSGATSTYDFTSIPATFRHLMLVTHARGDTAATSIGLRMRLQNVSTASYYDQVLNAVATTVSSNEALAATSARIGTIAASTAPANLMGTSIVWIPNYTNANKEKPYIACAIVLAGLTTGLLTLQLFGGVFDSTAAIDRITILPLTGNFTSVDSISTLYGLPA